MDAASFKAALGRAAAALATDPAAAERDARACLAAAPRDPRAALILGSALRRRGDARGALAILGPLARAYPRAAMTQYELGLVLAEAGDAAGAEAALGQATRLNRDHAEAWRALGELRFRQGDGRGADAAFAEQRRALIADPALKAAADALCAGSPDEAEERLRLRLSGSPHDASALRMLGELRLAQRRYPDAEALLAQALALAPEDADARFGLASALFHQQKAPEALPHLDRLLAEAPDTAAYQNLAAATHALVGDFDRALALYETLLAAYERQPLIWLNYGHALRTVGKADAAIAAFRRAIALDPNLTEAYLGLANLKVAGFTDAEVAAMRRVAARTDLGDDDRAPLYFALGKALEDAGVYGDSFDHYARGAALRRAATPHDAGEVTAYAERCRALFTAGFFADRAGFGAEAPDPIFIVGLPRSGSTLIEQILASHSAVEGTMELPDVGFAALTLGWGEAGGRYPGTVAGLGAAGARALGEGYLAATRIHRRLGRPSFIDKMPNNFQHIGLIQLMLPNARIIDARRHPLATCFSAFKQHFAQGQAFSYDLADLGRYYRDYVELMAHFDAVLPGRIHRVIYEAMVEDTEGEVRRLLAHCGLEFEPACLAFHQNDRAVRTVSSEQVRRPIFRDGLEQWRHFEPWLGPLKDALGPALDGWRV